jgi:aryl-alcohol dehydrogenase-like predicted oxidoreductase
MIYRDFGTTGLKVSLLGFGAGHIGSPELDEKLAESLLNKVLDLGINLVDTARSYGLSEERIGRYLSIRRQEFILSTKVGYTFRDKPDWSFDATMGTIEESLQRLKTGYLDIVHLHSCDKWFLEQGDAIHALEKAKEQGKVRVIAYSGENEALTYAIETSRFGSVQCSANLFDQLGIENQIRKARDHGIGIIAKRPLGNAVWRYSSRPEGHGHAEYWDRFRVMNLDPESEGWEELALRFTAFSTGIDCLITGTINADHLASNLKILEKGPLDEGSLTRINMAIKNHDQNWQGLI